MKTIMMCNINKMCGAIQYLDHYNFDTILVVTKHRCIKLRFIQKCLTNEKNN